MKIVLATTAKHKSEILRNAGIPHSCRKGIFDELKNIEDPKERAIRNAIGKAKSVISSSGEIIIGLDTFVVFENEIFEKPVNEQQAKQRLKRMSNRTNQVLTGICVIDTRTNKEYTSYAITNVTFNQISNDVINAYIQNEPFYMDSTGYIIEHMLSCFINKIEGEYYNILGVPCTEIYQILASIGFSF